MTTFLCQRRTPKGCRTAAVYRVHLRGTTVVYLCGAHLNELVADMPQDIARVFRLGDIEVDVTGQFVRMAGVEQRAPASQF